MNRLGLPKIYNIIILFSKKIYKRFFTKNSLSARVRTLA